MCENGEFMSLMLKLPSFFWTRITRISKCKKIILTKGRIQEKKQKLLSPFQIYRFLRERISPPPPPPNTHIAPPSYLGFSPILFLNTPLFIPWPNKFHTNLTSHISNHYSSMLYFWLLLYFEFFVFYENDFNYIKKF